MLALMAAERVRPDSYGLDGSVAAEAVPDAGGRWAVFCRRAEAAQAWANSRLRTRPAPSSRRPLGRPGKPRAHELEGVRGIPDQAITKPSMQRTR